MNCPRRHTYWQSKRLYWEGAPGWRAAGQVDPGELLCQVARSHKNGVSFWGVSGQSPCLAHIWSDSGPCWWRAHLSAKVDCSARDSGRLVGYTMGWRLLSPLGPSQFSQLAVGGSTMFLVGTSCCETAHASSYYCAWPRRAVSVSGSLIYRYVSMGG